MSPPTRARLVRRSAASPAHSQIASCGIVLPTITPSRHDTRASYPAHNLGEAVCEVKRARWDPRHDPAEVEVKCGQVIGCGPRATCGLGENCFNKAECLTRKSSLKDRSLRN